MFFVKDIAYQGHEGHWLALGFDALGVNALIDSRRHRAFPAMHNKHMFTSIGRNPEQLKPGNLWVEGLYGYRLAMVADTSNNGNVLVSMYPWFEIGKEFTAEINEVGEYENELEARIHAIIDVEGGQIPLCYFDPLYAEYRQYYKQGIKFRVLLSAMAYGIDSVAPPGLQALEAAQVYGPDDYHFHGVVHKIDALQLFDLPAWRVWITVINDTGAQITLPLIVSDHARMGNNLPQVGDEISGYMWLQGWLTSSVDLK